MDFAVASIDETRDDAELVAPSAAERAYRLAAPWAFRLAWLVARGTGTSRQEMRARAGWVAPMQAPVAWFHGASAGEVAGGLRLAALLRSGGFAFHGAFTAANRAGVELAARSLLEDDLCSLVPWDSPAWVSRAFDFWQPRVLFLVETELWPALIFEAQRRGVPVFCVNARIYPRDVTRYRVIRRLVAPALRRVTAIVAQNETERGRFLSLGAVPGRCLVGGNLKYLRPDAGRSGAAQTREQLGLRDDDRTVVVGSVHTDEVSSLFAGLEEVAGSARFIVAPRHRRAVRRILDQARDRGWLACLRSNGVPVTGWRLLVLDTIGELDRFYQIATVSVVGGGFRRHGGHDPFAPVLAGSPVLLGRHFFHFAEEATALAVATPEAIVTEEDVLGPRLRDWLGDESGRRVALARQEKVLPRASSIANGYMSVLSAGLRAQGLERAQ